MREPGTNSPAPWIVLGTAGKVFEAMLERSVFTLGDEKFEISEAMLDAGYDAMRNPSDNSPAPWIVLGTACKVFEAMVGAAKG